MIQRFSVSCIASGIQPLAFRFEVSNAPSALLIMIFVADLGRYGFTKRFLNCIKHLILPFWKWSVVVSLNNRTESMLIDIRHGKHRCSCEGRPRRPKHAQLFQN